jgi:hypothetical protein
MAYVNYMEVGKQVFVAGIAGTAAGAVHFMFLAPQFAGQMIAGVKTTTIVDVVIGLIVGIVTTMYTRSWDFGRLFGYGLATVFVAVGLLDQFNLFGGTTTASVRTMATPVNPAMASVPRASYLAPAGVVVNKHGTVPEVAAGTFG